MLNTGPPIEMSTFADKHWGQRRRNPDGSGTTAALAAYRLVSFRLSKLCPHPRTSKRIGLIAGACIAVLAAILLLTVFLMDWNLLRGPVSRMASTRLGRPVRIEGQLDVRLTSLTPTVSVGGLDIGNPAWVGGGSMFHAERVTVQVKVLELFKSALVLPSVRIERPQIHLLRAADGRTNWRNARPGQPTSGKALDLPVIQSFDLQAGEFTFKDVRRELEFKGIAMAKEIAAEGGNGSRPFRLSGNGTMNGKPFRFDVRGAPLVNVEREKPYPFAAEIVADSTHITAQGAIPRPFDLRYVSADLNLVGDDLADLYYISGLAFPNTPPYRIVSRLSRTGSLVAFKNMSGTVGDSDLRGNVSIELGRDRPMLQAKITSQSLDLDDVATWFGAGPSTRAGEAVSAKQRAAIAARAPKGKLFPDAKLRVARVRSMDAEVDYQAATVRSEHLPIRAASLIVKLNDGVLNFDPVSLALPEGKIKGTVRLDATGAVARTELDAKLFGVQLAQFKAKNSTTAPFAGVMRGRVKLIGEGNSVHDFVSASNGTATFVVPRGEVREALAEMTGVNVSRGLGLLLTQDQNKTNVRCGVADLKATKGTLQVQNLVFDTQNVLITGRGEVRLEDEQYDLKIKGQPKKLRLMRLKSPVAMRGSLGKPTFGLEADAKSIGQTGVAAVLGALVAPLAAVVAFVDPGLAKDADCASLLAEAKAAGAPVKTAEIQNAPRR